MATFNWPGFGISAVTPTLDQPAQVNRSAYTGVRAVASNPWHGKWSFKVTLATTQGDASFQAVRGFFTGLQGSINNFHLPAVEAPQNGNTGVTLAASASQGATSLSLTGVTTALVAGNMATIAGQLLSITSVGALSGSAQTINFMPALRAAAALGASIETAKPYALVALSDSSFSWDIAQWRLYGLSFNADEDVGGTDGASPSLDVWTGSVGSSGSGATWSFPALPSFTSRSLLAAVPSPTDKQVAYLTESSREGEFVFSASNQSANVTADPDQGVYVAPTAASSGSSGAWIRIVQPERLIPQRFYEATDPDFYNAMRRSADYLKATATSGFGDYPGGGELFVPRSSTTPYVLGQALDIYCAINLRGESQGINGGAATVLKFPSSTGIRVHNSITSGASSTRTADGFSGDGTIVENLFVQGGFSATESEQHGIHARGKCTVRNCYINLFPGDGFFADTTSGSGGATEGNCNNLWIERSTFDGCRRGVYLHGSDCNAGVMLMINALYNRQRGVADQSLLGNAHYGHHTSNNGITNVGGSVPYTIVHHNGFHYSLTITGNPANAPSGTATDSADWWYLGTGGITSTTPDWTSTLSVRAGGAYLNGAGKFDFCYSEGGQGAFENNQPGVVSYGSHNSPVKGTGLYRQSINTGASCAGEQLAGGLRVTGVNPSFTGPAGHELYMFNGAAYFQAYDRGNAAFVAQILNALSVTLQASGSTKLQINGTGLGFFGATPAAKPTVTGSRGGNAALASLLTALATLGAITDSSTA